MDYFFHHCSQWQWSLGVLGACVSRPTFLQRLDGRHVFSAQVEEGVAAVGQPDKTLCCVFEHQVRSTKPSRGEEVKALQSEQVNVRSF